MADDTTPGSEGDDAGTPGGAAGTANAAESESAQVEAQASTPPDVADHGEGVPADETPAAEATVASGGGGRYEELMAKRQQAGLTDREAEELGALMAEREGKPHSSAQTIKRGPEGEELSE